MDLVVCKCAKCDFTLGSILNLWIQIGKKYITPVTQMEDAPFKLSTAGVIREGEPDTLVSGCELQDAECAKCHVNLGQTCLSSPVNHVLNDGQAIFRIASVTLKRAKDLRRKVEPKIKRVLSLKNQTPSADEGARAPRDEREAPDSSKPTNQTGSLNFMQVQAELDSQRENINRIGATGMQVVSNFETVIARVDRQLQQLKESIESVHKGRDDQHAEVRALKTELLDVRVDCQNNPVLARLDQQLQTTDRVVTELRQALSQSRSETEALRDQLTTAQHNLQEMRDEAASLRAEASESSQAVQESVGAVKDYACEVSALRREVKQLRAELAQERTQPQAAEPESFSSHELDILASSISKIGNRASQVESLQMEFELFRTRLQRLEARPLATSANQSRAAPATASEPMSLDNDDKPGYEGAMRRKRILAGRDDTQSFDKTPHKRQALSPSDLDSGVSMGRSRADELYGSSPNTRSVARTGTRRTRAGLGQYGKTRLESWANSG
ncbi:hypothetical protein HIM_03873 [Hirsutella minnesotensis 3608]|uniref:Yippee/Mis18/Cereblon domain-containing protein n=1 Tax=Hirsutella minnesotensis 3608 TaxID=1043627 RepID=A0A0F8A1V4_9HYPO|nr:hypothetical protein HIM_03873 [Hirsutella minnesotensis 3608]